ncbi:excinuclease ATPase subunit [Vibrio sp. FJH11]
MKLSLLAIAVGSIILVGCNSSSSDDSSSASKDVRAFDGAIQGMTGQFECIDGSGGPISATNYDGFSTIEDETFVNNPETCSLSFDKTPGAIDTSNGKDMSNVSYSVPKGLLQAGKEVAATPLTTIIAKQLGEESYSEDTAKEILTKLGIDVDQLNNDGVEINVLELLTEPETALTTLKEANPDVYSKIMVTTVVLSDILVAQGDKSDVTVDQLVDVARRIGKTVLSQHPNYPESNSGDDIYVDLAEALADDTVFNEIADVVNDDDVNLDSAIFDEINDQITTGKPAIIPPVDTGDNDATGGTGGTGGSGSEGGGGA